jgi:hypothetical protein
MTPKEKANELFGKFAMYLRANLMYDEEANEDAKQCALIAVDEILGDIDDSILHPQNKEAINYWQEVKKEIEAL